MSEAFPGTADKAEEDMVHSLTASYMRELETGRLNPLYASEDLAGQVANGDISEDIAEEVVENLGIGEVIDD